MMENKKGGLINVKQPGSMVQSIILVVVALLILSSLLPTLLNSTQTIGYESGIQFATLFQANGAIEYALGAAVVLVVIAIFIGGKGGLKR